MADWTFVALYVDMDSFQMPGINGIKAFLIATYEDARKARASVLRRPFWSSPIFASKPWAPDPHYGRLLALPANIIIDYKECRDTQRSGI